MAKRHGLEDIFDFCHSGRRKSLPDQHDPGLQSPKAPAFSVASRTVLALPAWQSVARRRTSTGWQMEQTSCRCLSSHGCGCCKPAMSQRTLLSQNLGCMPSSLAQKHHPQHPAAIVPFLPFCTEPKPPPTKAPPQPRTSRYLLVQSRPPNQTPSDTLASAVESVYRH